MKRHPLLGIMTVLLGVPVALAGVVLVYGRGLSITHGLVVENALVATALFVAGGLLWSCRRPLHWVACGLWVVIMAWSVSYLIALASFSWVTGYLLAGVPVVTYLGFQFRKSEHAS